MPNVAGSYVTIYPNKAVTVSYPVAWFIAEKQLREREGTAAV